VVVLGCGFGCGGGKSGEEQAKEEQAADEARHPKVEPAATKVAGTIPVDAPPIDAPDPEPTTPAEIDHALNAAMLAQRPKDVLKYCDMGKRDEKSNPQTLLGCTLAACQLKDEATAKKWSALLAGKKDFMAQVKKVCLADGIGL
jgi:hypothetical protein